MAQPKANKAKTPDYIATYACGIQQVYEHCVHFSVEKGENHFLDFTVDKETWHDLGEPHVIRVVLKEEDVL